MDHRQPKSSSNKSTTTLFLSGLKFINLLSYFLLRGITSTPGGRKRFRRPLPEVEQDRFQLADRYYSDRLAADRLQRVYDLAPPRIQQYLRCEIEYVLELMPPQATVLELGCGYGRVLKDVARKAGLLVGIDTSMASLQLARRFCADLPNLHLACMDASCLAWQTGSFDVVICIQNGISAFHVDQRRLINESVRVLRPGGLALFASYSEKFWDVRVDWFERQSQLGLVGEIDRDKTGHGNLVCKDGFTATTVDAPAFRELTQDLAAKVEIAEVDESSLFCVIRV